MSAKTSDKTLLIPGPVGNLESIVHLPDTPLQHVAILCHPHPLHGGTMHNKVVHTVAKAFEVLHIPTVRFNYRGVGASDGSYAGGIGETQDCLAIYAWLQATYPQAQIILAGFSFGSFVALQTAISRECAGLISLAPPVGYFSVTDCLKINVPWLIIQGDADEIVSAEAVYTLIDGLPNAHSLIKMPNTSHFFHGKLIELREILIKNIQTLML